MVAAEADALDFGVQLAQLANEIGAVNVAAWLTGTEKDSHWHPAQLQRC